MKTHAYQLYITLGMFILFSSCVKHNTNTTQISNTTIKQPTEIVEKTPSQIPIEDQIANYLSARRLSAPYICKSPQAANLYEAHADDGPFIFLIDTTNNLLLDFLENDQIGYREDLICETDTTGTEYQLKGEYTYNENHLQVSTIELHRVIYWGKDSCDTIFRKDCLYNYRIQDDRFVTESIDSLIYTSN